MYHLFTLLPTSKTFSTSLSYKNLVTVPCITQQTVNYKHSTLSPGNVYIHMLFISYSYQSQHNSSICILSPTNFPSSWIIPVLPGDKSRTTAQQRLSTCIYTDIFIQILSHYLFFWQGWVHIPLYSYFCYTNIHYTGVFWICSNVNCKLVGNTFHQTVNLIMLVGITSMISGSVTMAWCVLRLWMEDWPPSMEDSCIYIE